jgi:glutathione S-transferase
MKLYSADLSPFAARVRMAIYLWDLPVEVAAPPGDGLKSPEYLAINPMGKVPALVLPDGSVIPESDTILEFLADSFPARDMRPASAADKAVARLIARVTDLYVMAPGGALFGQLNPATRDAAKTEASLAELENGLQHLNLFLSEGPFAAGDRLSTADCSLAPPLFFMPLFAGAFQRPDLVSRHGKVAAFWERIQREPAVDKVVAEMRHGLANFRA